MKVCTKCKVEKPVSEFARVGRSDDRPRARCKACENERAKTPEGRARRAQYARTYRAKNPEQRRKAYLKQYGLTPEEYDKMLAEQGGVCLACGTPGWEGVVGVALSIDHDHGCCEAPPLCGNCNRGLLCRGCNVALGNAQEDPATLRALADYIERWNQCLGRI